MNDSISLLETIIVAILAMIGSALAASIAARAELKRLPHQNELDDASASKANADALAIHAATNAKQAAENQRLVDQVLLNEKLHREELAQVRVQVAELRRAQSGPFRISFDFRTLPSPEILRSEITVIPEQDTEE